MLLYLFVIVFVIVSYSVYSIALFVQDVHRESHS